MCKDLNIYRGTTFEGYISLTDMSGNCYLTSDGDELIFGVREGLASAAEANGESEDILRCVITPEDEIMGVYPFIFTPEQTMLPEKTYYYYAAVRFSDGEYYLVTAYSAFDVKNPGVISCTPEKNRISGIVPKDTKYRLQGGRNK